MGNKLYEGFKVDIGLLPTGALNGNATGVYYDLADYRKAIAVLQVGAIAATFTSKIEVYQAINAAGGSGKLLTGATATITANTNVTSLTLVLNNVLNTHTVIINGLTFLAHTNTTVLASRQFSIAGTDTQDGDELVTCINDATYGVPGVTASNNAGTLTLVSTVPGATVITAAQGVGATITVATLMAESYVEIDGLTLESGFTHIACKVTTTSAQAVSAVLLRGGQRKEISQKVGASASV
jgi:hypothetical protein